MHITTLRIQNFRCIRSLELKLSDTTVLIGPNNAGKSAILEAVRILFTRRWGQRGTGFTENDVHRTDPAIDPRESAPIRIALISEESRPNEWHQDILADLEDVANLLPDGRNMIALELTCTWNHESESFDPVWHFLDVEGNALSVRRRSINLSTFFNYLPLYWLAALRDASDEFNPRSTYWGRLLKSLRVPRETEESALQELEKIDAQIVSADPRLAKIADTIGQATRVAIGQGPGAARLNTLPLSMEEMLRRTGILLRNEALRPWLPLAYHGQGLQSLAVMFMFQAVVEAQNEEKFTLGVKPLFAIEEPEAHLHPQAARTLWKYIEQLPGQQLITTHSPFFAQHVSLRDICIVRLREGCTKVAKIPPYILSDLPWNSKVNQLKNKTSGCGLVLKSKCVAASSWFEQSLEKELIKCYDDPRHFNDVKKFRQKCRILPSKRDEELLAIHGRRSRSEILFARHWILVEGVTEYLIFRAVGEALGVPLDDHGISVIDFQNGENAGIFPTLADAFQIPWDMVIDSDSQTDSFRKQILKRGFDQKELDRRVVSMPNGTIEQQLIADGHGDLLQEILGSVQRNHTDSRTSEKLLKRMKRNKTQYASALASKVAKDRDLAERMPRPIVDLIIRIGKDCL